MNYKDKLESLNENSAWVFTKQETDFDEAFKATKLFYEIPDRENCNIETYFEENKDRYEINTDRHRMLVIPQLFGLITKTPFYERGGQYNKEKPTEVFELIKDCTIGDELYNKIKTEQLLKIKIHAIIDTANNNEDYHILPVIFIYKVLKELQLKYDINKISVDTLMTYVMTCKNYREVPDAVEFIKNNGEISEYVAKFKDRSRVLTCIKKNIALFNIESNEISINSDFDEYFYENFISVYDFDELHEQLLRDVDYSYFLYSNQNFNINLIDKPAIQEVPKEKKKISITTFIEDEDENDYSQKVDSISEYNVNESVADGAHKVPPIESSNKSIGRKYRINPLLGKIAIKKAYYSCEADYNHETFISNKTNKPYMEGHHLIPICFQEKMWQDYNINVDCVENIVSLCPTCHKAFHYGNKETKKAIIENLYNKNAHKYRAIGLNIKVEEIEILYNI